MCADPTCRRRRWEKSRSLALTGEIPACEESFRPLSVHLQWIHRVTLYTSFSIIDPAE